jgi:hypothetical protein
LEVAYENVRADELRTSELAVLRRRGFAAACDGCVAGAFIVDRRARRHWWLS